MITLFVLGAIIGIVSLIFFPKGVNDPKWWMLSLASNFVVLTLIGLVQ